MNEHGSWIRAIKMIKETKMEKGYHCPRTSDRIKCNSLALRKVSQRALVSGKSVTARYPSPSPKCPESFFPVEKVLDFLTKSNFKVKNRFQ